MPVRIDECDVSDELEGGSEEGAGDASTDDDDGFAVCDGDGGG